MTGSAQTGAKPLAQTDCFCVNDPVHLQIADPNSAISCANHEAHAEREALRGCGG